MEGGDHKFAKFTVPTLKGFLKVPIQNVSGNKQELVARARGWQKKSIFSMKSRSSGQPKNEVKTLFPRSPSPFPCNFCKRNNNGIFTASQFYVQLPLLYTA